MAFKDIVCNLSDARIDSSHGWQVRISIKQEAIFANNQANQIQVLEEIIKKVTDDLFVDAKILTCSSSQEADQELDGTISPFGLDRDQRGKEVCIYLPNSKQCKELDISAKDYKQMLLTLWAELRKANIPLSHHDVPGDRKIVGPAGFPTPFSFTSETPGKEHKNKHGILFKQFKGYDDNHPILDVEFNDQDLASLNIELGFDQYQATHDYLVSHQVKAHQQLQADIGRINLDFNFSHLLNNDALIDYLRAAIKRYEEKFATLDVHERGTYQTQFDEEMKQHEDYQKLLNYYPHATDGNFSSNHNITRLRNLKQLSIENLDQIIKELRENYAESIEDIKADFQKLHVSHIEDETNSKGKEKADDEPSSSGSQPDKLSLSTYLKDQDYSVLIESNPAAMQAIYRRIIFMEYERRAISDLEHRFEDLTTHQNELPTPAHNPFSKATVITQSVCGTPAKRIIRPEPNEFDQNNSQVFSKSVFGDYKDGEKIEKPKSSDDKLIIGYTQQGLPFQIVVDGFFGGETTKIFKFIDNHVTPLMDQYARDLAESNNPDEITQHLIKTIYELRKVQARDAEFTMSIAMTYEKDNQLHCSGFGIGDTGIVLRRTTGEIEQLADTTEVNGFKDGFDNHSDQEIDAVIARNSLFHTQIQSGDEIFGYTYLFKQRGNEPGLLVQEPEDTANINVKKFKLHVDGGRSDTTLLETALSSIQTDYEARCEIAKEKPHMRFGDDCTFGSVVIPNKGLQQTMEAKIKNRDELIQLVSIADSLINDLNRYIKSRESRKTKLWLFRMDNKTLTQEKIDEASAMVKYLRTYIEDIFYNFNNYKEMDSVVFKNALKREIDSTLAKNKQLEHKHWKFHSLLPTHSILEECLTKYKKEFIEPEQSIPRHTHN